jgi:hypothetical protein
MSIQTANPISAIILNAAFETGFTALAATQTLIAPPIGALGGALFGATRFFTFLPLVLFTHKYLQANHPQASTVTKTLIAALENLASYAAAWGVLVLAGFSLTLRSTVLLSCSSLLMMVIFLGCGNINPRSVFVEISELNF